MPELETAPLVVRRQFPARVSYEQDGHVSVLPQALVILTRQALYVWTQPDTEPVLQAGLLPVPEPYRLRGTFDPPTVPLGTARTQLGTVEWTKGDGCGCHHPLMDYSPFPGPRRLTSHQDPS